MIVAAALLVYALVLAAAGPAWLRRADWPQRAPRLAIAVWQALSVAVVTATVLAGVALAVPDGTVGANLASWLRVCLFVLRDGHSTGAGATVAVIGLAIAAAVGLRLAGCLVAGLVRAGRHRRAHADALTLLARRSLRGDAVVVDHSVAAAYCLPGRHRRIVLTSAALAALRDEELAAVLAHEQAHLAGRHHLVLAFADGLRRAFPGVPLFRDAHEQIVRLVEMLADDIASDRHGRATVASAMAALAGGGAPIATLAAGGSTALSRARRLLAPMRPLSTWSIVAGFALTAAVAVLPAVVAAAPAAAALGTAPCASSAVTALSQASGHAGTGGG